MASLHRVVVAHTLSKALRTARIASQLRPEELACMLGVSPEVIELAETSEERPDPALMKRWATVLGQSLGEMLRDPAAVTPLGALMRSAPDTPRDRGRLIGQASEATSLWQTIGRATRVVRHAAELSESRARWRERLRAPQIRRRASVTEPPGRGSQLWKEGERLARAARQVFIEHGLLADEPAIPSMTELVERLGLSILLAPDGTLPPAIGAVLVMDGAGAGVLLNVTGGTEHRVRWSLAHELCHLLVDQNVLDQGGEHPRLLLASAAAQVHAVRGARTRLPTSSAIDTFDAIEKRANAFAAYFLAPRDAVREATGVLVDRLGPDERELVLAPSTAEHVAERFGMSIGAALHHIPNCFHPRISTGDRNNPARIHAEYRPLRQWHRECVPVVDGSPYAGSPPRWFAQLVIQAVEEQRIDLMRAYELLDERPTRTLGFSSGVTGGPGPLRDPLFDAACRVRQRLMKEHPDLRAVTIEPDPSKDERQVRLTVRGEAIDGTTRTWDALVSPEGIVQIRG